ncbi:beta-ketoacyl synthase [Pyronema omphalodes]|nr:beta-ketoacyl synthase [Pyronema omphalodes]
MFSEQKPVMARSIPLFGGQGSPSLFSAKSASVATTDSSTPTGSLLLTSCYKAFLDEISSLKPKERSELGFGVVDFPSATRLINVPTENQNNPIIHGTTLCLFQLLRYLSHAEASHQSFEETSDLLFESAGFCFGVLPAVVVSSSRGVLDFINRAVEVFRLSFWVGLRCMIFSKELVGGRLTNDDRWSLAVVGWGQRDATEALEQFHLRNSSTEIHLAAISSHNCVTLSGPGSVLAEFKASFIPSSVTARFAHVNVLFHAGSRLTAVKQQIIEDATRRFIRFPEVTELHCPVRSTATGDVLNAASNGTLIEQCLDMILVETVNWEKTLCSIRVSARKYIDADDTDIHFLSFGPGSVASLCGPSSEYPAASKAKAFDVSVFPNALERGQANSTSDIAIVGMGVKFPKGNNPEELWDTLTAGLNTVSEIPETRFDVSQYYDPHNEKKGSRRMGTKYGNFLDSPWEFDNIFFNISPREAQSMDPQQRVLLQTAYAAMENAGYVENTTESSQRDSFGCYVGVATGDYVDSLRDNIDVYYSTGTLRAFLSGRISYAFKLSGPSIVVDTACSSSLIAIYQACRAIQQGDCKAALAGGVNVICGPDMYLGLDRAHFLSPTGNCKAFDESADGYCRAEGCGMFVLKKLSDAIADNDQVLGVIKGIEANQSGNASSITHPHTLTQKLLFHQLLERTKVGPESIQYIEAHGTGTQAGDPAEVASLHEVFGTSRTPSNPLYIGSVKGNLGHCEAAAGSAGLAKLLLMLKHQTIPLQSSLKNLNPRITSMEGSSIIIPRDNQKWQNTQTIPRRALLNNFGAAGSNAALLLDEYPDQRGHMSNKSSYLFAFSAKTEAALEKIGQNYVRYLELNSDKLSLSSLCYTSTARRRLFDHRIAIAASSKEDLLSKLRTAEARPRASMKSQPVVFVFSGQGSQYIGMGKELIATEPFFRVLVHQCHDELVSLGFGGVLRILNADLDDAIDIHSREGIEGFQCAVFVLEYALAKLWISWGVNPVAVIGHSLGEYAALAISGVLKLTDALRIVATRAQLMAENCQPEFSGMLAINLGAEKIEQIIQDHSVFAEISVACLNSPNDCVVAGPLDKLEAFKIQLKSNGYKCAKLSVPFGYHSAAMDPILKPLTKLTKSMEFSKPIIPVASNVFGRQLTREDLGDDYFALHARSSVRFHEGLLSLNLELSEPAIYLEIGPHPITLPMVKSTINHQNITCHPSLHKQQTPWTTLTTTLLELYIRSCPVNWKSVYRGDDVCVVDLPQYPFSKTEYRIAHREPIRPIELEHIAIDTTANESRYQLLKDQRHVVHGFHAYSTKLSVLSTLIKGHLVGGSALCPASVYHELAYEAAFLEFGFMGKNQVPILTDIDYANPLVYDASACDKTVEIIFKSPLDVNSCQVPFDVISYATESDRTLHCTGIIKTQTTASMREKFSRQAANIRRQPIVLHDESSHLERVNTRLMYDVIFTRVVAYSKGYQSVQSMNISQNGDEGYGTFKIPGELKEGRYVVQPVFMDTLLHAAGFIANSSVGTDEACICSKVESVKIISDDIDWNDTFKVYCSILPWIKNTILAAAYGIDSRGNIVAVIKGMHFRRLRLASFQTHLATLRGRKPEITEAVKAQKTQHASHSLPTPPVTAAPSPRTASPARATTGVSAEVIRVIAETCGVPARDIDPAKKLEELGVDSLMSIEICETLKTRFQVSVDTATLAACATARDLEEAVCPSNSESLIEPAYAEIQISTQSVPDIITEDAVTVPTINVRSVLATTIGVHEAEIRPTTELEALGLDSLTSIELFQALHKDYGLQLKTEQFACCVTVKDLEDLVKLSHYPNDSAANSLEGTSIDDLRAVMNMNKLPAVLQSSKTSNPPLFLMHDGSGLCNKYSGILDLQRDVYGFFNPRFFSGEEWSGGLTEMAIHYASLIAQISSGPYIVGGWSYGGVVAFEAARHLQRLGKRVSGIVLIDSPCPIDHQPLPTEVIETVSRSDLRSKAARHVENLVAQQFKSNTANLVKFNPAPWNTAPNIILLRSSEGYPMRDLRCASHKWLEDRRNRQDAVAGWEKLVGNKVDIMDIPGNHFEPFQKENIEEVSVQLRNACRKLDQV